MKITIPSALLTTLLLGGSGRNGARAFSSSVAAIGGATRRGSVSSNAKTAAISYHYSTTSALRSSIAGGTAATTTTANAKRPTRLTTSTTVKKEMMDKTDVFIFDCDGVIWRVREGIFYILPVCCLVMLLLHWRSRPPLLTNTTYISIYSIFFHSNLFCPRYFFMYTWRIYIFLAVGREIRLSRAYPKH